MFGKDKVKSYSRVSKGKSGYKVIRVKEFLRKKDEKDNTARNIVLGVGALGLGIGATLLLKRKRVGLTQIKNRLKGATSNTPKYPKGTTIRNKVVDVKSSVIKEVDKTTKSFEQISDPWTLPISSRYADRGSKLLVKKPVNQNRIRAKDAVTNNPWNTPIRSSIKKESSELLVKKEGIKLLSPAKSSSIKESTEKVIQETDNIKALAPRGNLVRVGEETAKDRVISRLVNGYATLPLPMKVTLQMEKALTRPIKSSIGRPPDTKGLKTILRESEELPIEKVISKAKRKVRDRLKRQGEEVAKRKASDISKSNSELKKN